MVIDKKKAKNIVLNSIGAEYKVKDLGTKEGKYVFHANNDGKIPSDIIFAIDPNTGKFGSSMMSIKDAIASIK